MVRVKSNQVRQMAEEELETRIQASRAELFDLRYQVATDQIEDKKIIRQTRRNLARMLTIQHQRRSQAAAEGQEA